MDRIVVDKTFTSQLPEVVAPCVVFDSDGNRLGYFTPEVDSRWYHNLEPSVSDEELDRREQVGGGRSLASILADITKGP